MRPGDCESHRSLSCRQSIPLLKPQEHDEGSSLAPAASPECGNACMRPQRRWPYPADPACASPSQICPEMHMKENFSVLRFRESLPLLAPLSRSARRRPRTESLSPGHAGVCLPAVAIAKSSLRTSLRTVHLKNPLLNCSEDALDRQHLIDNTIADCFSVHSEDHRCRLVLRDDVTTGALHRLRSTNAVISHSRHYNSN